MRDAMLYALDRTRAITRPSVVDVRPTRIEVVTRVWNEGRRGSGSFTEQPPLALADHTKVRHLSLREVAGSGGLYETGDVRIGPITPRYTAPDGTLGGFAASDIAPALVAPGVKPGTEVVYRLAEQSGATGISGDYGLIEFQRDRTYEFVIVVRRRADTP